MKTFWFVSIKLVQPPPPFLHTHTLFIDMSVLIQENERWYVYVLRYRFCLFLLFSIMFWKCSDSFLLFFFIFFYFLNIISFRKKLIFYYYYVCAMIVTYNNRNVVSFQTIHCKLLLKITETIQLPFNLTLTAA